MLPIDRMDTRAMMYPHLGLTAGTFDTAETCGALVWGAPIIVGGTGLFAICVLGTKYSGTVVVFNKPNAKTVNMSVIVTSKVQDAPGIKKFDMSANAKTKTNEASGRKLALPLEASDVLSCERPSIKKIFASLSSGGDVSVEESSGEPVGEEVVW